MTIYRVEVPEDLKPWDVIRRIIYLYGIQYCVGKDRSWEIETIISIDTSFIETEKEQGVNIEREAEHDAFPLPKKLLQL